MITEVLYDYQEFCRELDHSKRIHWDAWSKANGKSGLFFTLIFRIYGISRKGHILAFEFNWNYSVADEERKKKLLETLIKEYAEPLAATPGRWELAKVIP
jgi:hypothetical protein